MRWGTDAIVERTDRVIAVLGAAILIAYLAATALMPKPGGRVLFGDGLHYFVQLRSAVFDRDFDFKNDYMRAYGLTKYEPETDWIFRDPTPTGRVRNYMPVGPAILWAPLYLLVTGALWLRFALGWGPPPDGFDRALQIVPGVTGVVAATIAAWLSWRLARRWTTPRSAAIGVLAVWLGSSALYYSLMSPSYTHAASMFACAAFFLHWLDHDAVWTPKRAVISGALAGVASLMRWQDALLLGIPILESLVAARRPIGIRLAGVLAAIAAWLVVFSPQTLVWHALYGSFFAIPQGPSFLQLTDPHPWLVLFSDNHGLFTWTPIVMLSVVGLVQFGRQQRRFALPLAAILGSAWYVNASVADWWAGEAFGARRFLSLFPLFVLGLATWMERPVAPMRRLALVAALVASTWLLLLQYQLFMKGLRTIAPYPKGAFDFWLARFVVPVRLIGWLIGRA